MIDLHIAFSSIDNSAFVLPSFGSKSYFSII